MINPNCPSLKRITTFAVLIAAFCIAFEYAHHEREKTKPIENDGNQIVRAALLCKAYAQTNDGLWPIPGSEPRLFSLRDNVAPTGYTLGPTFDGQSTGPFGGILFGPLNNKVAYTLNLTENLDAYYYFGFAIQSEREALALIDAARKGAALDVDIAVESGSGSFGTETLHRLRAGLLKELIESGFIQGEERAIAGAMPLLVQRPKDGHVWVTYFDLHAERLPYPGPFPASKRLIEALSQ